MAAANPTFVSLEEYLAADYEPACEYIDGELIPKAMGAKDHASLQARLAYLLYRFAEAGLCEITTELSLCIRPGEILIPDVCLIPVGLPESGIVTTPALLCIEILSHSDRFTHTVRKCEDFLEWGVPACWILDPVAKRAWTFTSRGLQSVPPTGTLRSGAIELSLTELFR